MDGGSLSSLFDALKHVSGMEKLCTWASNHHEKLGRLEYPTGKKADELDFASRMLCCIDIYQAVTEKRPYHAKRGIMRMRCRYFMV